MIRTANPALSSKAFTYERGSSSSAMTIGGTINKTGALLLLLLASAGVAWHQFFTVGPQVVVPWMFIGMIGGFILMAFGETIHLLGPLFFKFKEIPIELFGWITAFVFGFSSLGHYFSHSVSEKIGNKRALLLAVFGSPLLLLLATLSPKYIAIGLFVIPSIFFGLRNPIINHLLNLEVSSSKRATIISTSNFLGQLGLAIFSPMIGYFADLYTINTAFKISALLMFSVTILYFFLKDKN